MSLDSDPKDPVEAPRISMNGLGRLVNGKWHCECNVPARCLTTKKVGSNKGAKFWRCSRFNDNQCAFFLWVEHEAQAKAWLEVSQPRVRPPTPTSTEKHAEADHRHLSTHGAGGDHPPTNPFSSAKRKTTSTQHPDSDTDKDSRGHTLEGDDDALPPRKTSRLTPPRAFPTVAEMDGTSLPTPTSRAHRPASNSRSAAELWRRHERDTSPTPARRRAATSATQVGDEIADEDDDLTNRVVALVRADNPELKVATEMQLRHEIDLELDLSAAVVSRYERTIAALYRRLEALEGLGAGPSG